MDVRLISQEVQCRSTTEDNSKTKAVWELFTPPVKTLDHPHGEHVAQMDLQCHRWAHTPTRVTTTTSINKLLTVTTTTPLTTINIVIRLTTFLKNNKIIIGLPRRLWI